MANITGNSIKTSDFMRVLLTLKDNIMNANNVAEICQVDSINNDEIVSFCINDSSKKIICTKLQNLDIQVNDIVLVIFTNTDFRKNLTKLKKGYQIQNIQKSELHSLSYGVVIGLIYRKENINVTE